MVKFERCRLVFVGWGCYFVGSGGHDCCGACFAGWVVIDSELCL